MNGSHGAIVPAWIRHAARSAATLFVWVLALVLFGALLGSAIGLFAPGGPQGAGIGALRGGGIAVVIAVPFYLAGIGIGVRDNLRLQEQPVARPQTSDAVPKARSASSIPA